MSNLITYLTQDIWRIRVKDLPQNKGVMIRSFRIFLLSLKEFAQDQCYLRASALTFYSLLSIVPVFAMAFGVAKGFGLEQVLEGIVMERFGGQEEVATKLISFSQSFLENTKGGLIAGIGIVTLFWTVIKMLGNIENAFNEIWGVQKKRTFARQFSDYLSLMLICPIFLMLSSSMTVFITSQVTLVTQKLDFLGSLAPVLLTSLKILPYVILWSLFSFLYVFMPNTKIRMKSAILGGVIGGTIYQLVQWIYINFQVGVANFGAIYGSFAALPLFLLWLQISWLIVLYGAEIAFAHQNEHTYEFEPDSAYVSDSFKRLIALRITALCTKYFCCDQQARSDWEIAEDLDLPIRLVRQVIQKLVLANVLVEVQDKDAKTACFQPARDVQMFTIQNVLERWDRQGKDLIPLKGAEEMKKIEESLEIFRETIKQSDANISLNKIW